MATLIRNGNKIGFSSSDASLVNFVKSDGTRDTVQNEITSLNSAIANLNALKVKPIIALAYNNSINITFDVTNVTEIAIITSANTGSIFYWNRSSASTYKVCYGTETVTYNVGANFITSIGTNTMTFSNVNGSGFTNAMVFYR